MSKPSVLYEDNHVIAVFKPHGWVISGEAPSLSEWVKDYLKKKYQKKGQVFLGTIHRLDRLVAGVVVFGKTSKGASRLSSQFREGSCEKTYLARVEGCLTKTRGKLSQFHSFDGIRVEISDTPPGLPVSLSYRVLERNRKESLVEIDLHTGKKHQIRAQFSFIGHPILGDGKYGARVPYKESAIALLAKSLKFEHATNKKRVHIKVVEGLT